MNEHAERKGIVPIGGWGLQYQMLSFKLSELSYLFCESHRLEYKICWLHEACEHLSMECVLSYHIESESLSLPPRKRARNIHTHLPNEDQ